MGEAVDQIIWMGLSVQSFASHKQAQIQQVNVMETNHLFRIDADIRKYSSRSKWKNSQQQVPKTGSIYSSANHENMMKQLGIKSLRPGPSGDENAPNHANYDELLANPCPQLPDVLTLNLTCASLVDMWWKLRRPELLKGWADVWTYTQQNTKSNLDSQNYR